MHNVDNPTDMVRPTTGTTSSRGDGGGKNLGGKSVIWSFSNVLTEMKRGTEEVTVSSCGSTRVAKATLFFANAAWSNKAIDAARAWNSRTPSGCAQDRKRFGKEEAIRMGQTFCSNCETICGRL